MIILRKSRSQDGNLTTVSISGENFYKILDTVKSQESTKWIPKLKIWSISYNCVKNFIKDLRHRQIKDIVVWNVDLVKSYMKWNSFRDNLLKIKKIPLNIELIKYNEYIKNENPLLPFQTIGSHFLFYAKKAVLADTVGIGKTPQSIAASERLMRHGVFNTFVIVPASLKKKWEQDIEKFLGKNRSMMIEGNKDKRRQLYKRSVKEKGKFIIINYDLARLDFEDCLLPYLYENEKKRTVIFDEAQYLKNNRTDRSFYCNKLAKVCDNIFGLTATFLETSIMDVFNVMYVIDSTVLGENAGKFFNRHVKTDWIGNEEGCKDLDTVVDLVDPIKLRRLKEQVFDQLPERLETVYWCKMSKAQKACYDDVLNNVVDNIMSEERQHKIGTAEILTQMQYLIQTCLSPELLDYEDVSSAKLNLLLDVIDSLGGEKAVVFCFYVDMIEIIKRSLIEKGYKKVVAIHGSDKRSKEKRQDIINEFNTEDTIDILLTSDVSKFGLDLIGASVLINYDLRWNPAAIEQRNGRIDRIGQESSNITIMYLVTENSIEQRMYEVLYQRKEIADQFNKDLISHRIKREQLMYIAGIE